MNKKADEKNVHSEQKSKNVRLKPGDIFISGVDKFKVEMHVRDNFYLCVNSNRKKYPADPKIVEYVPEEK